MDIKNIFYCSLELCRWIWNLKNYEKVYCQQYHRIFLVKFRSKFLMNNTFFFKKWNNIFIRIEKDNFHYNQRKILLNLIKIHWNLKKITFKTFKKILKTGILKNYVNLSVQSIAHGSLESSTFQQSSDSGEIFLKSNDIY